MNKFLQLKDIPEIIPSSNDDLCENHFTTTTTRSPDGRYVIALPFKNEGRNLYNSFHLALKRYHMLENKFLKYPEFHKKYAAVIEDYLTQNQLSFVDYCPVDHEVDDFIKIKNGYYIPHFAVEKESSSTPLRVVFDASAKNSEFTSLNEILHVGPKLQTDICSILLNFRFGPIALTADIKQMYRNIWVRKQDRKYQKILWRPFPDATFGLSSSPFQAIRTIKQLSRDECSKYSQSISRILENDVYIDDVVTSIDSLDSAKTICEGLQTVLPSGGFELKKWESNNSNPRKLFPNSDVQNKHFSKSDFEIETSTKVLGLKWDPLSDNFSFEIKLTWRKWTKRQLLSVIARIWDPLGFLTPIVVKIKILLKKIWTLKIDWDEALPSFIITSWLAVYSELEHLNNYQIPRYLETSKQNKCSLFGFADSSEQAYGAVVYIKSLGNPNFLLISKSRVTPIKNQTLARLELCACHLLSKLLNFILTNNQHSIDFDSIYCFSDSMIVLHWLAGPATRWKTFVANRVTKIRDLIPNAQWLHIPSNQNAADCVSRGV
ncbi:uncharacterized protein LOC113381478 [Ctenocephalides felis]|uniref:uncharacterized protein LOC113381478 n=1 Tax=Ctenocephalides felis TaxID=7515 RepID=UPI000E6E519C|nr:uncharacterized protein LOC113381478 [Ctenocephalides felis]